MTDSFQRFGINHLSASQLNLWRSQPGIWALRYLAKVKDDSNAAMWRGNAVEVGLAVCLRTRNSEEATKLGLQSFELNAQGEVAEHIDVERKLIEPMINELTKWQPPSELNATQLKIEHWLEDVPVPVIGYLDFAFEYIDVDLKTTKACPSSPRPDHVRQVSIYRAARNKAGGLLYVTPKKHAFYEVDDEMMLEALINVRADALSLSNFLSRMETPEQALQALPIDWDDFRAPKNRAALANVFADKSSGFEAVDIEERA